MKHELQISSTRLTQLSSSSQGFSHLPTRTLLLYTPHLIQNHQIPGPIIQTWKKTRPNCSFSFTSVSQISSYNSSNLFIIQNILCMWTHLKSITLTYNLDNISSWCNTASSECGSISIDLILCLILDSPWPECMLGQPLDITSEGYNLTPVFQP